MKQQQSALSEWIDCGLTGTCDDARTARGEPSHIVTLAKQHALCQYSIAQGDMHNNQQKIWLKRNGTNLPLSA